MIIPIPLIAAGIELLKAANNVDPKENLKKVEEVFKKVSEDLPHAIDTRPFFKTKTFWTMAIGFMVPILNRVFGLNMDVTEITATISPLLLFIATEQWKKKG